MQEFWIVLTSVVAATILIAFVVTLCAVVIIETIKRAIVFCSAAVSTVYLTSRTELK